MVACCHHTWCLLFSTLSLVAITEWDRFIGQAPLWYLGEERRSPQDDEIISVFCSVITVHLYFHTIDWRELTWKLKLYIGLASPLSSIPPSFTLPPPFIYKAAILFYSNEGTSNCWDGGKGTGHWDMLAFWHISREQYLNQTCKLISFLLPLHNLFFQCDFPGSGWLEFTF